MYYIKLGPYFFGSGFVSRRTFQCPMSHLANSDLASRYLVANSEPSLGFPIALRACHYQLALVMSISQPCPQNDAVDGALEPE